MTALGMIETIGLVSALEAADAGLKAAEVALLGTDYVRGGLVMVRFGGEVAAVQAAVDAGRSAAERVGRVFSAHVIPRAMPEVLSMVTGEGCSGCGGCEGGRKECVPDVPDDFAGWKVVRLRQYARQLSGFPLTPDQIRFAKKQTLLDALRAFFAKEV